MKRKNILFKVENGVGLIKINRPPYSPSFINISSYSIVIAI